MRIDPYSAGFLATIIFLSGACWRELRESNRRIGDLARDVRDYSREMAEVALRVRRLESAIWRRKNITGGSNVFPEAKTSSP